MRRAISFCVDRHDRALEVEHVQKFRDRRNLVGLSIDRLLGEHESRLGGVSRNQMQRAPPVPATSSNRAASCRPRRSLPALRRAARQPRPQSLAAKPACPASETPCAKSAPSGCRWRMAETRQASPTPRSRSPPPLPSRPPRTPPQPASPAAPRPGDRCDHSRNPLLRHNPRMIQKPKRHGVVPRAFRIQLG